ncbi:hypothetical protein, partial [Salmonella enterica]|uniref:hypothetical protein n=2 Tax=Salmonella enterica TaxID=28901 RepID=UPI001F173FC6
PYFLCPNTQLFAEQPLILGTGSKAYLATGRLLPVITRITPSDGSLASTSESNISAMNFSITDNNNSFANFSIFSFSVSLFLNTVSGSCS